LKAISPLFDVVDPEILYLSCFQQATDVQQSVEYTQVSLEVVSGISFNVMGGVPTKHGIVNSVDKREVSAYTVFKLIAY
jgi:hypothetical protein